MSVLIQVVQAARQASDKRWIPEDWKTVKGSETYSEYRERLQTTWFSIDDMWTFIPSWDAKQCEQCGEIALGVPFITGSQLRSQFPYLDILDENTIDANVHINCRCQLIREGTEMPKEVLTQEEAKKAFIQHE